MALDWFKDCAPNPIALECVLALAFFPIALANSPEAIASQPIAVDPCSLPVTLAPCPNAILTRPLLLPYIQYQHYVHQALLQNFQKQKILVL